MCKKRYGFFVGIHKLTIKLNDAIIKMEIKSEVMYGENVL